MKMNKYIKQSDVCFFLSFSGVNISIISLLAYVCAAEQRPIA